MNKESSDGNGPELGAMLPDKEDIALRKGAPAKSDPKHAAQKVKKQPDRVGTPPWHIFILGLVILLVGFMYWQNYRLNQSILAQTDEINLAKARIDVLEGQLSTTDENLVMNEASIKAQLNMQMSEIRKLWDVSNKRNKEWIEENQAAVKSIQGKQTTMSAKLDSLSGTQNNLSAEVTASRAQIDSVETRVERSLSVINPKLEELSLAQNLQSDQIDGLLSNQDLNSLRTQLDGINAEISELESFESTARQDLESINSHRLQINQRLGALQDQIRALENAISSSGGG